MVACYFTADPVDKVLREPLDRVLRPLSTWSKPSHLRFTTIDEKGILKSHYSGLAGARRNPASICFQALEYWGKCQVSLFENGAYDPQARAFFLNSANWLLEHASRTTHGLVWQYDFDYPVYNMKAPWISALAQGLSVHVLTRATYLTGDKKYLDAARDALGPFSVDTRDGGVRVVEQETPDAWWYAAYPAPDGSPMALNGMLFALFGIHEFHVATRDERARVLYENGLRAVRMRLADYDAPVQTLYDRRGHRASPQYHRVHVNQMRYLYAITGDTRFQEYAERWAEYPVQGLMPLPRRLFLSLAGGVFPKMDVLICAITLVLVLSIVWAVLLVRRLLPRRAATAARAAQ